jgi:glycolate oxidase FAD binding subunit
VIGDLSGLKDAIVRSRASRQCLRIRGGGTKDFYGETLQGHVLETRGLAGIIDYEPTELVITARAGTLLKDVEDVLASHHQMLGFEPPRFNGRATLGGTVAAASSGPRRAYCGAVRDFILGLRMLDGRGEDLRFGGRVMKNVAGFDVSRLMAGSLGTLGLFTEITLKTLPRPPAEATLRLELDQPRALACMNQWAARPLPLSATAWHEGLLYVRLSGADAAVRAARRALGGEWISDAGTFWDDLREHRIAPLNTAEFLWRVSVPSTAPALPLAGPSWIEWGGALRWVPGPQNIEALRGLAARLGGHVTAYRCPQKPREGVFQSLAPELAALHKRLKAVFDPEQIFNRGRLYPDL